MNAKIRANVLKTLFDQLVILTDECRLTVIKEGIGTKLVDPAHVAMVDIKLEKGAFEEYHADDELELGLDLMKVQQVLKLCKGDELLSIEHEEKKNKLKFAFGNITRRMALVDTKGMGDPKIPHLELPGKAVLETEHMDQAMRACESVSSHCSLQMNSESFEVVAEGDTDKVTLSLSKEQLVDLRCPETIRSLFPLDYLSQMVRAIPSEDVTIRLGADYPVKMEFGWAEPPKPKETKEKGKGKTGLDIEMTTPKSDGPPRGSTTYLLAPRIESE